MTPFVLIALAMALVTVLLSTRRCGGRRSQAPADDRRRGRISAQPAADAAGLSGFVVALLAAGYLSVGAPLALDPLVDSAASNPGGESPSSRSRR